MEPEQWLVVWTACKVCEPDFKMVNHKRNGCLYYADTVDSYDVFEVYEEAETFYEKLTAQSNCVIASICDPVRSTDYVNYSLINYLLARKGGDSK